MANAVAGLTVKVQMDAEKLLRRHAAKEKKVLFKQGAYLKTAMGRSMRYATKKKKASQPGQPPLAHKDNPKGPMLRKLIKFEVDLAGKSVVCGPTAFGRGVVPKVLNEGGTIKTKPRKAKEDYQIGDFGPIRRSATSAQSRPIVPKGEKYVRVELKTAAMVTRSQRLAVTFNAMLPPSVAVSIKPRPFTAPLMTDGGDNFRKLIDSVPL